MRKVIIVTVVLAVLVTSACTPADPQNEAFANVELDTLKMAQTELQEARQLAAEITELGEQLEQDGLRPPEERMSAEDLAAAEDLLITRSIELLNLVYVDTRFIDLNALFQAIQETNNQGRFEDAVPMQLSLMIGLLGFDEESSHVYRTALAKEIKAHGLAGLESMVLNAIDHELRHGHSDVLALVKGQSAQGPSSLSMEAPLIVHDVANRQFLAFEGSLTQSVINEIINLSELGAGGPGSALMDAVDTATCMNAASDLAHQGQLPGTDLLDQGLELSEGIELPAGGTDTSGVDSLISQVCRSKSEDSLGDFGGARFGYGRQGRCSTDLGGDTPCATEVAEQLIMAKGLSRWRATEGRSTSQPENKTSWIRDGAETKKPPKSTESEEAAETKSKSSTGSGRSANTRSNSSSGSGQSADTSAEADTDAQASQLSTGEVLSGAYTGTRVAAIVAEVVAEIGGALSSTASIVLGGVSALLLIPAFAYTTMQSLEDSANTADRHQGYLDRMNGLSPQKPTHHGRSLSPYGLGYIHDAPYVLRDKEQKRAMGLKEPVPGADSSGGNVSEMMLCIQTFMAAQSEHLDGSVLGPDPGAIDPLPPDFAPVDPEVAACSDDWYKYSAKNPTPDCARDDPNCATRIQSGMLVPTADAFVAWFQGEICAQGLSTDEGLCGIQLEQPPPDLGGSGPQPPTAP